MAAGVMERWTLGPNEHFVKGNGIAIRALTPAAAFPTLSRAVSYEAVIFRIVPSGGPDARLDTLVLGLLPR